MKSFKIFLSKLFNVLPIQRIKTYRTILYCLINRTKQPMLIYQMGKVGSSSVYNTLKNSKHNIPVLHYHFLNPDNISTVKKYFLEHHPYKIPSVIEEGEVLGSFIKKHRNVCHWEVVSLVREPVSREISSVFQNIQRLMPVLKDNPSESFKIEQIYNLLMERFENFNEESDYCVTWFDKEIKQLFDINVYGSPFNRNDGFQIYHSENASLLLFRLENLSSCFTTGFYEFSGIDDVELVNKNIGNAKDYSELYAKIKTRIILPKNLLTKIYSSKYARKFYNEKEIDGFIKKWSAETRE